MRLIVLVLRGMPSRRHYASAASAPRHRRPNTTSPRRGADRPSAVGVLAMECFRIDEGGYYTGFDLLNSDQRFQRAAAIAISDQDAARLISEHFPKQAPELKYRALSRRPANHPRLLGPSIDLRLRISWTSTPASRRAYSGCKRTRSITFTWRTRSPSPIPRSTRWAWGFARPKKIHRKCRMARGIQA